MFGKKKETPQIDKEQLELIKTAQKRIKQKRSLYIHFVFFLIGSLAFIIANLVFNVGATVSPLGINWFVYAILAWSILFIYHAFNVYFTHKFLGEAWEKEQLNKLVALQKERIAKLEQQVEKDMLLAPEKKRLVTNSKNSEITIIVAAGENDEIGKDNQLIWHLSDDLKRFKELTNGHHIIMGRKTFESFPKPLPNRIHVVISRQANYQVPTGVIVVNNLQDAFDVAKSDKQPFVIGGGEIYTQAMAFADKIELTRVHENFDADTFFPKIDPTIWKEVNKTNHPKDEKHLHAFSFLTYVKH
ncbi:dihydrofolate reductase [Xanthomarina sp.]|uniref:dihydrofolate reductase n=1 Tax=Xanthomarina sp. TaxID=1931211 RepID=UPI002B7C1D67|nr:dihydrofolate reductase [Xanthomarina sp.]HLV38723.1 dihydrofolate reductase [Xanthomarina sp.]